EGFTGVEVATSYKNYGADGDWNLGLQTGFGEGDTNVIIAAEWDHRSELDTNERSFARGNYAANPAPWSTLTNLAGWTARSPFGPVDSPDDLTWGGVVGLATDFTPDSCNAVGGIYRDVFTCKYNYIPYYNLVEESDTYRLYLQVNSQISDNDNFHMQLAWARVHTPHATGSPAQPVIRGPATNQGATYQFFVPMGNPYVDEFVTRTGFAASPFFGITSGFTPITYRAFAHGGNSTLGVNGNFGAPSEIDNRYMHFSTGVDGLVFDTEISYDVAFTFNHQSEYNDFPDVIGSRLQEALNGFGGANCDAADLDPTQFGTQNPAAAGTGSCQWWNPFASGWAGQPILGLSNPNHVPGTENPDDLARWIFNERAGQNILWNATVDAVVSGQLGLELGGGPVAWALGTQWRTTKLRESVPDPLFNGNQPCAWPGQDPADPDDPSFTGCTEDRPGPFVFFDTDIPESQAQDQESYFLELNLPILDNLYMVAAARYEQFQPVDLDATVYKVSLKFDATDNLSFRGSYGTNYQAPGLGITPGEITNGVNSYTIAAGNWRGAQVITESGIEPETAKVWNTGLVWQSEGYGDESDVYLSLDYWNIETEDELGLLASANDVANAVFSIAPGGAIIADIPGDVLGEAFKLSEGEESEARELGDGEGYFFVQINEVTPPALRPYEDVSEEVDRRWRSEERNRRIAAAVKQVTDAVAAGSTFEEAAAPFNRAILALDIVRESTESAFSQALIDQIFKTDKGAVVSGASALGEAHVIVEVREIGFRQELVSPGYEAAWLQRLSFELNEELFEAYIEALRQEYGVKADPDLLAQLFNEGQ
ncbi:MAG: TonB-dependent receptor, partial [Pseudomonadales bacterium]